MATGVLAQATELTKPEGLNMPDWANSPLSADAGALAGTMQGASTYLPSDASTVSGQLGKILAKGDSNSLVSQAMSRAAAASNRRGLLNSSIGASAGESAAIDAAMPIAQADAGANLTAQRDNAGALNTFAAASNAFARDAATRKLQGALDLTAQGRDLSMQRAKLLTDVAQNDASRAADTDYRAADLAFRQSASGRELDLKGQDLAQTDAYRTAQLKAGTDQAATQLRQQAQTALTQNIASIRQQATQSMAALEADPNMTGEAKANAITNIGRKVQADIAEQVRFSGLSMPSAWPDWINQIDSTFTAPPPGMSGTIPGAGTGGTGGVTPADPGGYNPSDGGQGG